MSEPKSDMDSPQAEAQDDVLKAVEESDPAQDSRQDTRAPEPEPEPVAAQRRADPPPAPPAPPAPPPPARRSGAVLGGIIGAVLALGGGYAALRYAPPGLLPMPDSGLGTVVEANAAALAALKAQVEALPAPAEPAPAAPDPALLDRLAAVEAAVAAIQPAPAPDLSGLETKIAALEDKVAALAARPEGSAAPVAGDALSAEAMGAIAALQAEVAALKSGESGAASEMAAKAQEVSAQLQAAQAEAQKMADAAAAESRAMLTRAALTRLQAALDSGVPYAGALADLGVDPVPEALSAHAETGVPTLADLTDSFPEAARAALEAALKAQMGSSWTDRAMTFLRTETGIRSVNPREGNDPDAVLSRAEAAVQAGRLVDAMAEIAALPPEGQAALQAWTDRAKIRIEAETALTGIAATLGQG